MKEKIKELLTNRNIWFFTLITVLFFGILLRMEFAIDSYATLTFSMEELISQFAPLGRFVILWVGGIIHLFNLKSETIYMLSYLVAILCMIISLYKLYQMIKIDVKYKDENKISSIQIYIASHKYLKPLVYCLNSKLDISHF